MHNVQSPTAPSHKPVQKRTTEQNTTNASLSPNGEPRNTTKSSTKRNTNRNNRNGTSKGGGAYNQHPAYPRGTQLLPSAAPRNSAGDSRTSFATHNGIGAYTGRCDTEFNFNTSSSYKGRQSIREQHRDITCPGGQQQYHIPDSELLVGHNHHTIIPERTQLHHDIPGETSQSQIQIHSRTQEQEITTMPQTENSPITPIRILQVNLNNSRIATALVWQQMTESKANILILQEPHLTLGRITGTPARWKIALSGHQKAAIACSEQTPSPLIIDRKTHHVTIRIPTQLGSIEITSIYVSPSMNLQEALTDLPSYQQDNQGNRNCIIAGDLNAKSPAWGGHKEDGRGLALLNYMAANWLTPMNDPNAGPTCVTYNGSGWPDATITNISFAQNVQNWTVLETESASDHRYISYSLATEAQGTLNRRRYKTCYGGHGKFAERLGPAVPYLIQQLTSATDVAQLDRLTDNLIHNIRKACNRAYKKTSTKPSHGCTWWTPELKQQQQRIKAYRRKFARTQCPIQKTEIKDQIRKIRALFKKNIRITRLESWRNFCSSIQDKFGTGFKIAHSKRVNQGMLEAQTGTNPPHWDHGTYRDNILKEIFHQTTEEPHQEAPIENPDFEITQGEIKRAISTTKCRKAPGPDNIDGTILKVVFAYHPRLIQAFFNACIRLNYYPRALKVADIVLLKKETTSTTISKIYRPICLLPVIGKALEKILIQRINHHLDKNNILDNRQHGFRRGFSTETALDMLLENRKDLLKNYKIVTIISLDIQGAFDNVRWPIIINIIRRLQLPAYLINTLTSYLSNRHILLEKDKTWQITKGCPQGSSIGPLLWNLVANTAFEISWPPNVRIQAYADDFALMVGGSTRRHLEQSAGSALNTFQQWAEKQQLQVSAEKTKSITYGRLRRRPYIKMGGRTVQDCKTLKYLGVTLDNKNSWLPHIANVKAKAIKTTYMATRMAAKTWGLTPKLLRIWYQMVPEKIITYACSAWFRNLNCHGYRALLSAQRHYLLQITRAARNVSNDALAILANVTPLDIQARKYAEQGRKLRLLPASVHSPPLEEINHKVLLHPATEDTPLTFQPPEDPEYLIYTDGSKLGGQVGCAFVAYDDNQDMLQTWMAKLGATNSVFQAELTAIREATKWAIQQDRSCIIHTDSLSALQALQQHAHKLKPVQETKALLRKASKVHLTWVRAHIGIAGNEAADTAAKHAALDSDVDSIYIPTPHSYVRRSLKIQMLQEWQERWSTSNKGRDLWPFIQKIKQAAIVEDRRLVAFYSGHGPFPAILNRHQLCASPDCICGSPGTPEHYISECPRTLQFHCPRKSGQTPEKWFKWLYSDYYAKKRICKLVDFLIANEPALRTPTDVLEDSQLSDA